MGPSKPLCADEVDRRLRRSLDDLRRAERNAVLWFAEVQNRKLFRNLGFSSIYHYATEALGFSRPRTAQFIRLCDCLDDLPALKNSLATGDVSWTKAREIAKVATPATDTAWVELARRESRRKLERRVRLTQTRSRAKRRGKDRQFSLADAGAGAAAPDGAADVLAGAAMAKTTALLQEGGDDALASTAMAKTTALLQEGGDDALASTAMAGAPVNISLRFSPEQYARYEALMEKLRKNGERGSREELHLAGMEALLTETERPRASQVSPEAERPRASQVSPGKDRPDYQIVVQQCEDCGRASIATSRGKKLLGATAIAAIGCDALVHRPGERNRATIPPATRRKVLARDGYRCQTPGCGAARFLEVHHRVPREKGGSNKSENLVTLCSACHRLTHEGNGNRSP